jgi:septal ring factor EnvC (AmiA/AmiB activator)
MEQETMFKEILNAFKLHAEKIDERFEQIDKRFEQMDKRFEQMDKRFEQMDKRFDEMDKRFDRLETKTDGIRMDLTDTQKTTHFLLRKVADHDEKLLELSQQQK